MKTNDGGQAFPQVRRVWDEDCQAWAVNSTGGMTLRDFFAVMALAGSCANPIYDEAEFPDHASDAYRLADAMLAERNKQP